MQLVTCNNSRYFAAFVKDFFSQLCFREKKKIQFPVACNISLHSTFYLVWFAIPYNKYFLRPVWRFPPPTVSASYSLYSAFFLVFCYTVTQTFCSSVAVPSIHCIGHSLGGHICGFTGKELKKRGAAFKIRQGEGDDHHDLSTVYFYFLAFCSFRYVLSSHGTSL